MSTLIECSACTGRPIFMTAKSYLSHVERNHDDEDFAPKKTFSVSDISISSEKVYLAHSKQHSNQSSDNDSLLSNGKALFYQHDRSIDWLTKKIASQEQQLAEVKDNLQWIMGVLSNTTTTSKQHGTYESRTARMEVLRENALRIKKKEIELTEEIEMLKQQRKENDDAINNEEKLSDEESKHSLEQGLATIIDKLGSMEEKICKKLTDEKSASLIEQKDHKIQKLTSENKSLSEQRKTLQSKIEVLKEESEKRTLENTSSITELEQLKKEIDVLKDSSKIQKHHESITTRDIEQAKIEIEKLQKQLKSKDDAMSRLQTKASKRIRNEKQNVTILQNEKVELLLRINHLESSVKRYEDELAQTRSNIKQSEECAQERETKLLQECIKKLESKHGVERNAHELLVNDLTRQLNEVKAELGESQKRMVLLEDEKIKISLELDENKNENEIEKDQLQKRNNELVTEIEQLKSKLASGVYISKEYFDAEIIKSQTDYKRKLEFEKQNFEEELAKQTNETEANLQEHFDEKLKSQLDLEIEIIQKEYQLKLDRAEETTEQLRKEKAECLAKKEREMMEMIREKDEIIEMKDRSIVEIKNSFSAEKAQYILLKDEEIVEIKTKYSDEKSRYVLSKDEEIAEIKNNLSDEKARYMLLKDEEIAEMKTQFSNEKARYVLSKEEEMTEIRNNLSHEKAQYMLKKEEEIAEIKEKFAKLQNEILQSKSREMEELKESLNEKFRIEQESAKLKFEETLHDTKNNHLVQVEQLEASISDLKASVAKSETNFHSYKQTSEEKISSMTTGANQHQSEIASLKDDLEACRIREQELTIEKKKDNDRIRELEEKLRQVIDEKEKIEKSEKKRNENLMKQLERCKNDLSKSKSKVQELEACESQRNDANKNGGINATTNIEDNVTINDTSSSFIEVKVKKSVSFNEELDIRYFDKTLSLDEDICLTAGLHYGEVTPTTPYKDANTRKAENKKQKFDDDYFDDLMDRILQIDDGKCDDTNCEIVENRDDKNNSMSKEKPTNEVDDDDDDVTEDVTVSDMPENEYDYEEIAELPEDDDDDKIFECQEKTDNVNDDVTEDYEEIAQLPHDDVIESKTEPDISKENTMFEKEENEVEVENDEYLDETFEDDDEDDDDVNIEDSDDDNDDEIIQNVNMNNNDDDKIQEDEKIQQRDDENDDVTYDSSSDEENDNSNSNGDVQQEIRQVSFYAADSSGEEDVDEVMEEIICEDEDIQEECDDEEMHNLLLLNNNSEDSSDDSVNNKDHFYRRLDENASNNNGEVKHGKNDNLINAQGDTRNSFAQQEKLSLADLPPLLNDRMLMRSSSDNSFASDGTIEFDHGELDDLLNEITMDQVNDLARENY